MGSTSSKTKAERDVAYLSDANIAGFDAKDAASAVNKADIARQSLRSNNSIVFQFFNWVLIILAGGSIATGAYIVHHFFDKYPDKEEMTAEKTTSIFLLSAAVITALILSYYYLVYLYNFVRYADIFVTDLTRLTTAPESDFSFKHNLTNLISHKIGRTDDKSKAELFTNLARSVMIDPVSYLEREAETARKNGNYDLADHLSASSAGLGKGGWGGGMKKPPGGQVPALYLAA